MNIAETDKFFFRPDHFHEHPVVFRKALGSVLWDTENRSYLDLFAAMGAVNCGHGHPRVVAALREQVDALWISSFFPSDVQIALIEAIDALVGPGLRLASLSVTGAEAIEQAIRLARARTGRRKIVSFKGHFHGKTQGAMHLLYSFPPCYGPVAPGAAAALEIDFNQPDGGLSARLREESGEIAAVIFEPVIGYSGPIRVPPEVLRAIRRFCDESGAVMIADEILTGCYRCGGLVHTLSLDLIPDLLCFGKGFGNGFPISGTLARPEFQSCFKDALLGSTFSGNALGCAAALGTLECVREEAIAGGAERIERAFRAHFSHPRWSAHGIVPGGTGALLSLRVEDPAFRGMKAAYLRALEEGVVMSHTARGLRISPPLNIGAAELAQGLEIAGQSLLDEINGA